MNAPASSRRSPVGHGRRQRANHVPTARAATGPAPIFILYGHVSDARDAVARVTRLLRPDQSARGILPMFWRFDQLAAGRMREMALRDASRAQAVVLALGRATELDRATDAWLAELARQRRGAAIHVLTLIGEEAWTIALEEAAAQSQPQSVRGTSGGDAASAARSAFNRGDIAAAA